MYCIACGAQNADQDRFCNRCGKPLVTAAGTQAVTAATPRVPAAPSGAYRQGNKLVVPKGAPLPPYCVKCGHPFGQPMKNTFYWHSPWLYLLVLVNILVYAIVAMIIRKRADLMLPLCAEHRQRRRNFVLAAWVLFLGSIPAGIVVGSFIEDRDNALGLGILTVFLLLISGFVVAAVGTRLLRPKEITDSSATFTGACEQFLALLPSR